MNKHKPNHRRRPHTQAFEYAGGLVFLALFCASCGDDVAPNPSIDGVCDFDRELDDCFEDETLLAQGHSVESWEALCQVQCRDVSRIAVTGASEQQLRSLNAFRTIRSFSISNSKPNVTDLSFLSGQTTFTSLSLNGNGGLKTLSGLESLETIQPADGSSDISEISEGLDITDSSLEEISLPSFRFGIIRVRASGNLKTISLPELENGSMSVVGTDVETIRGANEIGSFDGGIVLQRNPNLRTLDAFESVEYMGGFIVEDNANLSCAEIEPIASDLDTGEFPFVVSGNKETCDL